MNNHLVQSWNEQLALLQQMENLLAMPFGMHPESENLLCKTGIEVPGIPVSSSIQIKQFHLATTERN